MQSVQRALKDSVSLIHTGNLQIEKLEQGERDIVCYVQSFVISCAEKMIINDHSNGYINKKVLKEAIIIQVKSPSEKRCRSRKRTTKKSTDR